ncbi:MAG: RHS repeat-associated core domain-containing protein, partial [Saprospiraceae bacterium]|nr:RHS repeat-associated core domain-containing protein [Saprospiraceae bacterium]
MFTYKERDAETGWDNLGARLYDSDISRFFGVDPLGEERAWVSSYNYAQNNPIMRIDTDGELDSPIFDKNGNFLGVDSEGYTGEIIIMDRTAFKTVIRKKGNQPLNHDQVMIWAEKSPLVAKLNDGGLSAEGFSKVYTHVVEQMEGELVDGQSFSLDKLEGGIINIIDTVNDHEGLSQLNGERYGNPTNIPISAEAGTKTNKDGRINVTTRILFGKGQMTTVEHAQSTLGVHEYYGHGVRGLAGGDSAEHRKVYRL